MIVKEYIQNIADGTYTKNDILVGATAYPDITNLCEEIELAKVRTDDDREIHRLENAIMYLEDKYGWDIHSYKQEIYDQLKAKGLYKPDPMIDLPLDDPFYVTEQEITEAKVKIQEQQHQEPDKVKIQQQALPFGAKVKAQKDAKEGLFKNDLFRKVFDKLVDLEYITFNDDGCKWNGETTTFICMCGMVFCGDNVAYNKNYSDYTYIPGRTCGSVNRLKLSEIVKLFPQYKDKKENLSRSRSQQTSKKQTSSRTLYDLYLIVKEIKDQR